MQQTNTLIVGASIAGLALAACLRQQHIDFIIIEKSAQTATPWRNHYQRLHLHTNKRRSHLPYKKFERAVPRYPSRQQVLDYLEAYQDTFAVTPVFNTTALSIRKEGEYWITNTNQERFQSAHVIMATGAFGKPQTVSFTGMESFNGRIMHSSVYQTGKDFEGEEVLVIGFGNSACEIAIDLYERGAKPSMSVRSAVNVIPRDVMGIPVLELSLLLSPLQPRLADIISRPLMKLLVGDITKLGLQQMRYGPLEQISKDGRAPVLDIGTIRHIRRGHIHVHGAIDHIKGNTVYFKDGKKQNYNSIIAATGYGHDYADIVSVDASRFEDLKQPVQRQQYFGKDGLYFCGYRISPTGQIREIARNALQIAKHIAAKKKSSNGLH